MRTAAASGFDPYTLGLFANATTQAFGISHDQSFAYWRDNVVANDKTDWNICDDCMVHLEKYLLTPSEQKIALLPAAQLVEMIDETPETDGQRLLELSVIARVSARTYGETKFIKELIQATPRLKDGKTRAEITRKRGQILLAFGPATEEVSKRYLKATEASLLREAVLGGGCLGFLIGFIPSMFAIAILYRIIAALLPNANTTNVSLTDGISSETVLFAAAGFLVAYYILWSIISGIRYSKQYMSESRKKISDSISIIIIVGFHCLLAFLLALAN
jgi:hypothetical protein